MADVLVVGSIHLDRMVRVAHFPLPGETALALDAWTQLGGKAANQAVASANLHPTRLVACIGDDGEGAQVRAALERHRVDARLRISPQSATGSSVALIDDGGENVGVISPAANADLLPGDVLPLLDAARPALVLCQWESPLRTLREVFQAARARGIPTLLNAAPWRPEYRDLLPLADHVIVNAVEAAAWVGRDVRGQPETLPFHHPHVTVTLGADGASHYEEGRLTLHQPAPRVQARSTHGAGDHFVGTLAALTARGLPLEEALRQAGHSAAAFVQTLHKPDLQTSPQRRTA